MPPRTRLTAIGLVRHRFVIDDEDVVENGLSGTHAAMIVEVTRRVERLLAKPAPKAPETH